MCGIAGLIDLAGRRAVPAGCLAAMAGAMVHRGPDQDGFLELPGVGLASRRLSIVGPADGRQPIANEDGAVLVVFNGEIFDYPELRLELEGRGHRFKTHCDTEVIPHLWEETHEQMFERLRGQFSLALWDQRRGQLLLARSLWHLSPLLDPSVDRRRRMVVVRLRDQGLARDGAGAGSAGFCAASTRSSLFSLSPGRSPVFRACRRCCPDIS